ncbi:hypothetical protein NIES4075_57210 [Tolypothrix sp. NIES-4075]|uniref:hypothetical protein n=1 Tax=Tolypothrix sp. NIES-4075 TaxID=2005459 RepID=UPI000B5C6BCB|nr:hypothetical protein [Tolypothrix sp. NIES-4075]GAX44702.1 hypothetical protein NIES4075_57210 [Tolypothrix sp. NIES-4075]
MTKPLGYYLGSLDSDNWSDTLQERFGSQLQLMSLEDKLAARACITYWLFHQEIVQNSLGDYSLAQAALDTMTGWTRDKGDALEFCQIVQDATRGDLEGLIECLTSNIRWGN